MARIYLASSWRNERQPAMVGLLRGWGHEVYDFRNPPHGEGGFAWSRIEADWQGWDARVFRDQLLSPPSAAAGYLSDYRDRKSGVSGTRLSVRVDPGGRRILK